MNFMEALFYTGEKQMELRKIPMPEVKNGNYLVKVISNGICGSDFEGYLGKTGRRTAPMIMGHEFSGVIEKAPENGKYDVGESITVFPKPFCGSCEYCKKGFENVCPNGTCMGVLDNNGSMCEFVEVEEKYILPFSGIDFDTAAMTEPLAVAYRSVFKISDADIADSEYILVEGAGTIGLLVIAILNYRGAKNIIVSDASDWRLSVAQKMGASFIINPRKDRFIDRVIEITKGKMVDISIEAVGISPTANDSVSCLRIGGTAVWIGNAQKVIEINMQQIVTRELTIKGNYVYSFDEFKKSLVLLESGKIDVSPLMTDRYTLKDGVQAFRDLENNREGKMLKVFIENR